MVDGLSHPLTGVKYPSPVPAGTGWPDDPATVDTPVATTPSEWSAPGIPSASQQHVPVHVRPPAVTRCGVGAKQNGCAIQTSVVPGERTSACASWSRR